MKMKRISKILLFVTVFLLLICPVFAAEYSFSSDSVGVDAVYGKWDEVLASIPEELREDLGSLSLTSAEDDIREKTSLRFWLTAAWDGLTKAARDVLPSLSVLVSVIILSAVGTYCLPCASPSVSTAFSLTSRVAAAIPLISSTYTAVSVAGAYLTRLTSLVNIITPVMEIMYLSSGSISEGAVTTTGLTVALSVVDTVNSTFMPPVVTVLFTLASLSAVCSDVRLGGLVASVRKLLMRLWQIMTLFFSFMIGTQTVIARSADTLSTRTARFAISSMIPVAGGIIAEAYNTLKEGVAYIRGAAGIGGIILILCILLTGIIPLLVYKAAFGVTAFLSEMLGLDGTSKLLGEIKSIIDLIIAVVLYSSLMFVFVLVLFAKSREV